MNGCVCGVAQTGGIHSEWCPLSLVKFLPETNAHVWSDFDGTRGKYGSWSCVRCGVEVFRKEAQGAQVVDMPPVCRGRKP